MSDFIGGGRAEFGVLFVDGFREQRPGSAIALLAGALYRWLFYWNAKQDPGLDAKPDPDPPVLSEVELSSSGGEGDQPAHLVLSAPLHLSTQVRDARWLLAESSWADLFTEPRFLGLTRWIWKVSTCLLVMQFVTPMRRHWRAHKLDTPPSSKPDTPPSGRQPADWALAGTYLVLMGLAAMLSVLLAALLLVVALAAYLPIPRIDKAVRWVIVHIAAMLGDSYMLAHCPVQLAAMRTHVASDLAWLLHRCEKVAVVAHSQGAALAHQVLKEGHYRRGNLTAFITLGQGISKFDLLRHLDWDPQAQKKAHRSRVLVTTGMACAGLPAVGLVIGHWANTALISALTTLPWWPLLITVGFTSIALGVHQAMNAVCDDVEYDLGLPDATFAWSDYYASADPVSNGPIDTGPAKCPRPKQATGPKTRRLPTSCNEVYNSGSVTFDHNGYLRNHDELLPSLLNDLVGAAYGEGTNPRDWPKLVRGCDVAASTQRRRRLLRGLIAARIAAAGLLVTLWWADSGRALKHPMQQLMHLFSAPSQMSNDTAIRFLAAALITAVFYIVAVFTWQAAIRWSVRRFFRDALFPAAQPCPDVSANQAAMTKISSGIA